jgi:hypothetical protein
MQKISAARRLSQIFLWLVPFVFGPLLIFVYRHSESRSYLIGGTALATVMLLAAWVLGASVVRKWSGEQRWLALAGLLLIAPVALVSVFAGLGPPPQEPERWLATAVDQEIRYTLLLFAGLFAAGGFVVLRECLRQAGERIYSALGFAAMIISTALFVFYITGFTTVRLEALRQWAASGKMPEWHAPLRYHFWIVGVVEVALTYLATAAFAAALRSVGWLGKISSQVFVALSLVAVPLVALFPLYPSNLALPGSVLIVPAVPFIMPYLIGVNLLRRVGDSANS